MVDRRDKYIQQAKDFYRNTYYIPTAYDAQFHKDFFASPVTIRNNFGSWENYINESFSDEFMMESKNKMYYGGFGHTVRPQLSENVDNILLHDGRVYKILWDEFRRSNFTPRQIWVMKKRMSDILDGVKSVLDETSKRDLNTFRVFPATANYKFPSVVLERENKEDKIIIASLDTPVISDHYKRCLNFTKMCAKYHLISLNGVKANHIRTHILKEVELT